ncbi:SDR family NAD(P)-dependent oxidoreductase [Photobacterium lutimaris]|uniref:Carrier domain-containing protein n=1 Tax=Photobacterium lutimaris TaxID=388278 RepID=A0A2T3J2H1_9GAMM|nr:SDR family NAD(P)-dependent oxidoreductase [Photobacterium lutimaris]PSU35485.1 hypothetical protein C9I99_00220 [Photobacterium lutimaris]TDR78530.1 phosphopantetheine binding protein [Photobacterium lutimaris]
METKSNRKKLLELIKSGELSPEKGYELLKVLLQESREGNVDMSAKVDNKEDIAIIGMACKYAGADNIDEFWANLKNGVNCITEIPKDRWNVQSFYDPKGERPFTSISKWGGFVNNIYNFDCGFFNISPREAELMDPQQRLFLEESYKALEQSGYGKSTKKGLNCGVFVGYSDGDYKNVLSDYNIPPDAHYFMGNSGSILAARISYHLNLKGASIAVDTACSSSLVAINLACRSIVSGETDMALAGGITLFTTPNIYYLTSKSGMLSIDGKCKTFDKEANGFVPGEGVGVVVLKRLSKALEDGDCIHSVIKGYKLNQDGKTNGITAPNSNSQTQLEMDVYREFNINPETIAFVEAHGTGTVLGDPIEINALTDAFAKFTSKKNFCGIGSVKSNIGHAQLAAGVAGVIKASLSLKHEVIVPTLNFSQPNPHLNLEDSPFYVNTKLEKINVTQTNKATVSAFGFSGTNAHIVIECSPHSEKSQSSPGHWPICISARNEESLKQKVFDLLSWIHGADHNEVNLADLSYTLLVKRELFRFRKAWAVNTLEELRACLAKEVESIATTEVKSVDSRDPDRQQIAEFEQLSNAKNSNYKEVTRICDLFNEGIDCPWHLLFASQSARTLNIPTYPFSGKVHKIQQNVEALTVAKQLQHRIEFSGNEFFLEDHTVNQAKVLPGVLYLEYALQAAKRLGLPVADKIENVVWLQPFIVNNTSNVITVEFVKKTLGWNFRFFSGADSQVIDHAQGLLSNEEKRSDKSELLDFNILRKNCIAKISREEHYRQFKTRGIEHGPRMQGVQVLLCSDDDALSEISAVGCADLEESDFLLHPTVLDSALQCITATLDNEERQQRHLYLPFGMKNIVVYKKLSTIALAHVKPNVKKAGSSIYSYDITLADKNGVIQATISEFTMRKVQAEVTADKKETAELVTYERRFMPEAARKRESALSNVIVYDLRSEAKDRDIGFDKSSYVLTESVSFSQSSNMFSGAWRNPKHIRRLVSNLGLKEINLLLTVTDEGCDIDAIISLILAWCQYAHTERNNLPLTIVCSVEQSQPGLAVNLAALESFAKSIKLERKNIHVSVVFHKQPLSEIVEEIGGEFREHVHHLVKYSNGKRFIQRLVPITLPEDTIESSIEDGKLYLITGGAGSLGLILGQHIVQHYHSNVVLVSRSCSEETKATLSELNSNAKGTIEFLEADVSNDAQLHSVVDNLKKKYGVIHGVFHMAGVIDDSYFWNKSMEAFAKVVSPKVVGVQNLDRCTTGEPLDFFVCFSSVTAITGNVGQIDYTYANGYLDYWARERNNDVSKGLSNGKTISINWPFWGEGGMQIDEKVEELLKNNAGIHRLQSDDAIHFLKQCIQSDSSQIVLYNGNKEKIQRLLGQQLEQKVVKVSANPRNDFNQSQHLRLAIQSQLKEIITQLLKVSDDEFRLNKEMSEYGFDSISFTTFANSLNERYSLELMPLVFFEYPTIQKLTEHLLSNHHKHVEQVHGQVTVDSQQEATPIVDSQQADREEACPGTLNNGKYDADDIAIVGMNAVLPNSANITEFWNHLVNGDDMISEVPSDRWNWKEYQKETSEDNFRTEIHWGAFMDEIDKFDAPFFNISPREAQLMDPQQRLFLQTVWSVIEDAGYKASDLAGSKTGLFVGVSTLDYAQLLNQHQVPIDAYTTTGRAHSILANRASYFFDFRGPSEPVDTACSSSLISVIRAVEAIRSGSCDQAIAGGVNVIASPELYVAFNKAGMLSPDGKCKTFDESANGYARGEGTGALFLKKLSKATEDKDQIYAVIKGGAINHGGKANSLTAPNPAAQKDLLVDAYSKANISPENITYIEAHGTGTALGDPLEIEGLKKAFNELFLRSNSEKPSQAYCGIGAVKSNIGHLEAAAGVAGLIKTALAIKSKTIPPSINFHRINPLIDLEGSPFYIVDKLRPWDKPANSPRIAGVSSFGYGGANAHVVLQEHTQLTSNNGALTTQLIPLSAIEPEQLQSIIENLYHFLIDDRDALQEEVLSDEHKDIQLFLSQTIQRIGKVPSVNAKQHLVQIIKGHKNIQKLCKLIEVEYDISVDTTLIFDYPTIDDLVGYITQETTGQETSITDKNTQTSLDSIAYTLQVGRESMEYRLSIIASSIDELIQRLGEYVSDASLLKRDYSDLVNFDKSEQMTLEHQNEIEKALADSNMPSIGRLWKSGCNIDWSKLYQTIGTPVKMSLPTYPFAKERYWFTMPENVNRTTVMPTVSSIHPLLDENISNMNQLCFRKTFAPEQFYIHDHNIDGNTILPGVAYLEMARAAGEQAASHSINLISNIIWGNPILIQDEPLDVKIELVQTGNNLAFSIKKNGVEKDVLYSKGLLTKSAELSPLAELVNIDALKEKCQTHHDHNKLYEYFSSMGFHYGPAFKVLEEVYVGNTEALGKLKFPDAVLDLANQFKLHIPLMDGALQTVLAINAGNTTGAAKTYIPFSLERLEIHREITSDCYALVKLTHDKNDIRKFNITLLNNRGETLVQYINFTARALVKPGTTLENKNNTQNNADTYLYKKVLERQFIQAADNYDSQLLWLEGINTEDNEIVSELSGDVWHLRSDSTPLTSGRVFVIDSTSVSKYELLLEEIVENGQTKIDIVQVFNNLSGAGDNSSDFPDFENKVMNKLFFLSQRFTKDTPDLRINFLFVDISGHDQHTPAHSMLAGFGKSCRVFNRNITSRNVIISCQEFDAGQVAEIIRNELIQQNAKTGEEIVYHNGNRFVTLLQETVAATTQPSPIKAGGTYIITGGVGKIGLAWAKQMTNLYNINLILTGRTAPTGQQNELIQEMSKKGSSVIFRVADISDKKQVSSLVHAVELTHGSINGIFHAAGSISEVQLPNMKLEEFKAIWKAKIYGAQNLSEVLANKNIDFFVMFSSVSSIIGDFGACNYAMANAYLDAFCLKRNSDPQSKGITISLSLPLLDEGNMQIPERYKSSYVASTGMTTMKVAEAYSAFNHVYGSDNRHVIIVKGKKQQIEKMLLPARKSTDVHEAESVQAPATKQIPSNQNLTLDDVLTYLKDLFAKTLKMSPDSFQIGTPFEKYGIDSMMVMELNDILGKHFEALPQTLFFEYFNLKELAGYFFDEYHTVLVKLISKTGEGNNEITVDVPEKAEEKAGFSDEDLFTKSQELLSGLLAETSKLPINKIKPNTPFDKYGIDSMIIMDLNTKLESYFSEVPQTLFFEYQTIKELTAYFVNNERSRLCEIFDINTQSGSHPQTATDTSKESTSEATMSSTPASNKPGMGLKKSNKLVDREVGDIAVIGMSGRYPMAKDLEAFWDNLSQGKDCIEEIPIERFDHREYYDPEPYTRGKSISKWGGFINNIKDFDADFFNVIPRVANMMDPQERLFLETVYSTIENAGYFPNKLVNIPDSTYKTNVGVYLGFMYDDYKMLEAEEVMKGNLDAITGYWNASLANRISYQFDFTGPSVVLDTACSSSLIAIHMACESIRNKECYQAVAGGVNLSYHPSKYVRLSLMGMASSDGRCRSFGEGGDGYVPGEGVGAVLLKPLDAAIRDNDNIMAVVKGSAVNHGGKTNGFSVPNPNAQAEVIEIAQQNAQIKPREISYVETHGTGTPLGDPIEILGLNKIFKKSTKDTEFCYLGSVKSNVGHCEGAAGVAAFSKTVLQLKHKKIAPSLHSSELNKKIDFRKSPFTINQKLKTWNRPVIVSDGHEPKELLRTAGISSFGAGGVNGHIIIQEWQQEAYRRIAGEEKTLIVLSAKNQDRLIEYVRSWDKHISKHQEELSLEQVAYVAQTGREFFKCRLAVIASSLEELLSLLRDYLNDEKKSDLLYGEAEDGEELESGIYDGAVSSDTIRYLAERWVSGANVDFNKLYTQGQPRKVELPGYPFTRKEYWIPIAGKVELQPVEDRVKAAELIPKRKSTTNTQLEEQKSGTTTDTSLLEIKNKLKHILGEITQMPADEISDTIEFSELGIDSITIQQFSKKLLGEYSDLSETAVFAYQSIGEMGGYILENMSQTVIEKPQAIAAQEKVDVQISKSTNNSLEGTKKRLTNMLAEIIGQRPEEIDSDTPFSEYGIDSITIAQFTAKILKVFEDVSETALFAYQTIIELAEYLVLTEASTLAENVSVDAPMEETVAVEQMTEVAPTKTVNSSSNDIAIIGVSVKVPGANGIDDLWANLLNKKTSISEIKEDRLNLKGSFSKDKEDGKTYSRWGGLIEDVDKFDPLFFNISPKEAEVVDPQERLFLQSAWELLEDAGYTKDNISKSRNVGVFIGVTTPSYNVLGLEEQFKGKKNVFSSVSFASIANRVSYVLNLNGPSVAVDTMCSSSLVAIHEACGKLLSGECDTAIAGGVNLYLHPSRIVDLCRTKLLADDELNRSFTSGGIGFVPGESVTSILLKPLKQAEMDNDHIYGVIKGSAVKHTGRTNAYFTPNPKAYEQTIKSALENAQVDPATVSYIEAQATGSELSDAIELESIQNAYASGRKGTIKIGSLKPNLGHSEAASGVTQLVKVLLQFKHEQLLPTILHGKLNPRFNFGKSIVHIQKETEKWSTFSSDSTRLRAGVSSYGAGGTGGHIILERYNQQEKHSSASSNIFNFSAKTASSLKAYLIRFRNFLENNEDINLSRVARTLQVGREQFKCRIAVVADDIYELLGKLKKIIDQIQAGDAKLTPVKMVRKTVIDWSIYRQQFINAEFDDLIKLWLDGDNIDWQSIYGEEEITRISLPTYSFDERICWVTQSKDSDTNVRAELATSNHNEVKKPEESYLSTELVSGESIDETIESNLSDEEKQLLQGQFMISNYLGLYLLQKMQDRRVLFGSGMYNLDEIIEALQMPGQYWYVIRNFLNLLEKNGLVEQDNEQYTLTALALSKECKDQMRNINSRDQLILRAMPEFTPFIQLFKAFNGTIGEHNAEEKNVVRLLQSEEVQAAIPHVLSGEHRLSAALKYQLNLLLSEKYSNVDSELAIVDFGIQTSMIGNTIINALSEKFNSIRYHVKDHPLPNISAALSIGKENVLITPLNEEFGEINAPHKILLLPFKCDEDITMFVDSNTLVISYMPIETELLALTLGWQRESYASIPIVGAEKTYFTRNRYSALHLQARLKIGNWLTVYDSETIDSDNDELVHLVLEEFAGVLNMDASEIDENADLSEYGVNSILFTRIFSSLNEKNGNNLDASAFIECKTVAEVANVIALTESTMEVAKDIIHSVQQNTSMIDIQSDFFQAKSGINYEIHVEGSGQPVVFLTALAFTFGIWEEQLNYFKETNQVILLNLPAHGNSGYDGQKLTFDLIADDIASLLDSYSIVKAHVVGWCMAGNIAQVFANKYQSRISSLALLNTTAEDAGLRGINGEDLKSYSNDPLATYDLEFQNIYQGEYFTNPGKIQKYLGKIRCAHSSVNLTALMYYIDSLFQFDFLSQLKDINVRTLVVAGSMDITYPPEQVKALHNELPDSVYIEFKKGGHMPFLNEYTDFNQVLSKFIHDDAVEAFADNSVNLLIETAKRMENEC